MFLLRLHRGREREGEKVGTLIHVSVARYRDGNFNVAHHGGKKLSLKLSLIVVQLSLKLSFEWGRGRQRK